MTDAKTGITAKMVVGNFVQRAEQLRSYMSAKGLYKYIVGNDGRGCCGQCFLFHFFDTVIHGRFF